MPTPIEIVIGKVTLQAELNDSPAAKAIAARLPFELRMSRWGDEYYGGCGVDAPLAADARDLMEVGELAYWPPGKALCIFFGRTPVSCGDEPRAASEVNPVGRVSGDLAPLQALGASIRPLIRKRETPAGATSQQRKP